MREGGVVTHSGISGVTTVVWLPPHRGDFPRCDSFIHHRLPQFFRGITPPRNTTCYTHDSYIVDMSLQSSRVSYGPKVLFRGSSDEHFLELKGGLRPTIWTAKRRKKIWNHHLKYVSIRKCDEAGSNVTVYVGRHFNGDT
jgi:hypothetical protein